MLITESQMGMKNNALAILDQMSYLTEAESVYAPAMVPIVENSTLQANIVRLEDMIAFGEANGIEDLGYALTLVCEADQVDPASIVFSVQETNLIDGGEIAELASQIMAEGCAIVGVPVAANDPMNILAEAAVNYAIENNDDGLLEAYANLEFTAFCEEGETEGGQNPDGIVAKVLAAIKSAPSKAYDLIKRGISSLTNIFRKTEAQKKNAAPDKKGFFDGLMERISKAIATLKSKLPKFGGDKKAEGEAAKA